MEQLLELVKKCKGSVSVEINSHKDCYQSVAEYLQDEYNKSFVEETDPEILKAIIKTDTVVELVFYPDTPNGFYKILHYDILSAIAIAMKTWQ